MTNVPSHPITFAHTKFTSSYFLTRHMLGEIIIAITITTLDVRKIRKKEKEMRYFRRGRKASRLANWILTQFSGKYM